MALVQVGDGEGKSRAIAVGRERRGWIRENWKVSLIHGQALADKGSLGDRARG